MKCTFRSQKNSEAMRHLEGVCWVYGQSLLCISGMDMRDTELVNRAMELKLRCERRIGELLIEMKERGEIGVGQPQKNSTTPVTILSDLHIDRRMSSRSQKIAQIPEDIFEVMFVEHIEQEKELTRKAVEEPYQVAWNV